MEIYENTIDLFLDGEIWKDIDDFPDYQISNFGRVKSFKKYKNGQILKQCKDTPGYLFINLWKNKKKKQKSIHHLVYESFYEKLKEGECVHHGDGNKLNNIFYNLKLMTKSGHHSFHNIGKKHSEKTKQLMSINHIDFSGENNPNHKLIEQEIIEICKYLSEGILTQKEIAKIFKISQQTISYIKKKYWNNNW